MKKILITGANGYIGSRLSKLFYENGYSVFGICYPSLPQNSEWEKYFDKIILGDLRDISLIKKITQTNYDIAINLVSLDHHQSNGEPTFVNSINVTPTLSLLKAFSEKNTLKKFIYFSTIHVYGQLSSELISEKKVAKPQNIYGLTHFLSEQIVNYYNSNSEISCINIRLSNSFGSPILEDNNCWGLVVNDLCKSAFIDNKIILQSDGSPQRDFVHGNDIYNALESIINYEHDHHHDNIYHVSSGETYTILELAHIVKEIYFDRYKIEVPIYLPGNVKSESYKILKSVNKYTISNTKIISIGFKSEFNIRQGIEEVFDYLEKKHV